MQSRQNGLLFASDGKNMQRLTQSMLCKRVEVKLFMGGPRDFQTNPCTFFELKLYCLCPNETCQIIYHIRINNLGLIPQKGQCLKKVSPNSIQANISY